MANILNRTTKVYLISADPNDYDVQDWIIDPDVSEVAGFETKYWTITGDVVTLMSQAERDAVDAQEAADAVLAENARQKSSYTDNQIFRAQIKYVVDEINILRQATGTTPARTYAQAQQYMFDAIDNGEV